MEKIVAVLGIQSKLYLSNNKEYKFLKILTNSRENCDFVGLNAKIHVLKIWRMCGRPEPTESGFAQGSGSWWKSAIYIFCLKFCIGTPKYW